MTASSADSLANRVSERHVPSGHVIAWWLGGSGFIIKSSGGAQVWIDPYLSDAVKAIFGQGRAFPPPITPEEGRPDAVISTHWHEDHLDPEAIPALAKNSPGTTFIMPPTAMARAVSWGVPRTRIVPLSSGDSTQVGDILVSHIPARHVSDVPGWEVPDAMGVVLSVHGLKVYHTGDTEYDLRLRLLRKERFDVIMACINGTGGNMNAYEAALLAQQIGVGAAIPIHHYLWAGDDFGEEATMDPRIFADTYRRLGGTGQVIIPTLGGEIDLFSPR